MLAPNAEAQLINLMSFVWLRQQMHFQMVLFCSSATDSEPKSKEKEKTENSLVLGDAASERCEVKNSEQQQAKQQNKHEHLNSILSHTHHEMREQRRVHRNERWNEGNKTKTKKKKLTNERTEWIQINASIWTCVRCLEVDRERERESRHESINPHARVPQPPDRPKPKKKKNTKFKTHSRSTLLLR